MPEQTVELDWAHIGIRIVTVPAAVFRLSLLPARFIIPDFPLLFMYILQTKVYMCIYNAVCSFGARPKKMRISQRLFIRF